MADKTRLLHDHLLANPRRVLGPQPDGLRQCVKHTQFFPAAESCLWCLSAAEERAAALKKTDAGMTTDTQPEDDDDRSDDDYDTWANMMAMRMHADRYLSQYMRQAIRGMSDSMLVDRVRRNYPLYAQALGFFDRDPPAAP